MRITGGNARGILLSTPRGVENLRPSTDFLREAVFSSLGQRVRHALVLDLFAGVGSYGLEALSRGAAACVFVENRGLVAGTIADNAKRVKKSAAANFTVKIFCQDAFAWAKNPQCAPSELNFDIIFADPPYDVAERRGGELVTTFSKFLRDSDESRIILEVPGSLKIDFSDAGEGEFGLTELRRIGRTGGSRQPNALIYGKR